MDIGKLGGISWGNQRLPFVQTGGRPNLPPGLPPGSLLALQQLPWGSREPAENTPLGREGVQEHSQEGLPQSSSLTPITSLREPASHSIVAPLCALGIQFVFHPLLKGGWDGAAQGRGIKLVANTPLDQWPFSQAGGQPGT